MAAHRLPLLLLLAEQRGEIRLVIVAMCRMTHLALVSMMCQAALAKVQDTALAAKQHPQWPQRAEMTSQGLAATTTLQGEPELDSMS